jgi:hypothetical protein
MQQLDYSKRAEYLKMGVEESANRLKGLGYVKYPEFGWIKESRLNECVNKGYIKSTEDEFLLTEEGAKYNTWVYILGNSEYLRRYESVKWGDEKDGKLSRKEIFKKLKQ